MIMDVLIADFNRNIVVWVVLGLHVLLAIVAAWKTWRGENSIARLMALDLTSTLLLALLILVAIISDSKFYIDLAIPLAALSYISTAALAKFISDHKVF